MPQRDPTAPGAPCWVQLTSSDVARSREFYSRLFGWVAEEPVEELGGYFTFTRDGVAMAGSMGAQPGGPSDTWSIYLSTADADKTTELVTSCGGQVVVPPMTVSDLGTMAFYVDPGGAGVGAWQTRTFAGLEVVAESGTPAWFELHTPAYDAALGFYRDAFGWTTEPLSGESYRYAVLRHGEDALAGVMDAAGSPPAGGSGWLVYLGVDDTDAGLARAVELGASVLEPAQDTPHGRMGTLADPTGAVFTLVDAHRTPAS